MLQYLEQFMAKHGLTLTDIKSVSASKNQLTRQEFLWIIKEMDPLEVQWENIGYEVIGETFKIVWILSNPYAPKDGYEWHFMPLMAENPEFPFTAEWELYEELFPKYGPQEKPIEPLSDDWWEEQERISNKPNSILY